MPALRHDRPVRSFARSAWFRWRRLAGRRRTSAALDRALRELAEAHAELARRASLTAALLETIEVGIVSCDADGVVIVSNRAERELFGLETGLEGLRPEELHPLISVFDPDGRPLSPDSYPLMRALRGEDVSRVDVLVGPSTGVRREVVVRASQITGPGGAVLGAVAALTDVTDERVATRALVEERRKLAEAQVLGQLGGFDHDVTTGQWTYSDELCALWGAAPGSMSPERAQSLIVEQDRRPSQESWLAACRLAGNHSFEFRIRRAGDGAERVLRARVEVAADDAGQPVHVRGTHLDITDLDVAQRSARRATAFSDAVLAASPDTTLVTDLATGAIVYASSGKDLLGFGIEEFRALRPEVVAARIHPDDRADVSAFTAAAHGIGDGRTQQQRYRSADVDGQWRWLDRCVTPFRRDPSGAVVEILEVLRDVTDLVRAEELLTYAARHDSLTGLPNRALLIDTLEAALDRSGGDEQEVAVLFIDLDRFKKVNDTGGHSAGDAVLQETARRLAQVLRAEDTVARVGGDEFVIVVEPAPRATTGEQEPDVEQVRDLAVRVAERVTAALCQPITVRGLDHVVTASIGITYATRGPTAGRPAVTVDDVLHRADGAMYRAKGHGRNRYEVLDRPSR